MCEKKQTNQTLGQSYWKVLRVCLKEWRETAVGRSSVQAHGDSDRRGRGIRPKTHESRANWDK